MTPTKLLIGQIFIRSPEPHPRPLAGGTMMSSLRLAHLPGRTPVMLTLMILPDPYERLFANGALHDQPDGPEVSNPVLPPAALIAFLNREGELAKRKFEECL